MQKTESTTKRKQRQLYSEAVWQILERESEKPDCPFRDWEYTKRFFGSGEKVNLAFVREVHREVFDPILSLPNGGSRG